MNNEIVKKAAEQIVKYLIVFTVIALFIGLIVGGYFLDHYRWGGCK